MNTCTSSVNGLRQLILKGANSLVQCVIYNFLNNLFISKCIQTENAYRIANLCTTWYTLFILDGIGHLVSVFSVLMFSLTPNQFHKCLWHHTLSLLVSPYPFSHITNKQNTFYSVSYELFSHCCLFLNYVAIKVIPPSTKLNMRGGLFTSAQASREGSITWTKYSNKISTFVSVFSWHNRWRSNAVESCKPLINTPKQVHFSKEKLMYLCYQ